MANAQKSCPRRTLLTVLSPTGDETAEMSWSQTCVIEFGRSEAVQEDINKGTDAVPTILLPVNHLRVLLCVFKSGRHEIHLRTM